MKVSANYENFAVIILQAVVVPFVGLFMAVTTVWWLGLATAAVILAVIFPYWLATGRTFVFDAEGITVRLGFYSRRYRWEDLKTKRIERYRVQNWYFEETEAYTGWAEFSVKEIRRPRWQLPEKYSTRRHPLSYIFVHFPSEKFESCVKYSRRFAPCYVTDEQEFLSKMQEWGVELERL